MNAQLSLQNMAEEMLARQVRKIHVIAWRDFDDAEAGGSEKHADEFMSRWQEAGLSIVHRTSLASGQPTTSQRHGYEVIRRGGRMTVFPRVMLSEVTRRMGDYDALVEIWNGVPWLSPLWCRKPKLLILHHVHGPMWNQMFPRPIAAIGRALETRIAPPFYRRIPTVTTSDDSRQELLHLGWKPEMVSTGPVGVDEFFTPGESKTLHPSIVAVGRQAPVKRFIELLEQVKIVRRRIPEATLTLIGDGPDRGLIEQWIEREDAHDWVTLTGRISREELRSFYRRSWLMTSASLAEGWGLVLTEAAGCGTPAVATDIGGHRCSVIHGETGLLTSINELGQVMTEVLENRELRERLGRQAETRSRTLTWDALAAGVLEPLYRQTVQRH